MVLNLSAVASAALFVLAISLSLIERGLLKKQRREDNARFVSFSLTPQGKKELKAYLSLEKKKLADAVESLSDDEQNQLLDLSTKLRDALKSGASVEK